MGFSKPKAIAPVAAPPPVTTSAPEVAQASNQERRDQANRSGYDASLDPTRPKKTLLSAPNSVAPVAKSSPRTLLTAA